MKTRKFFTVFFCLIVVFAMIMSIFLTGCSSSSSSSSSEESTEQEQSSDSNTASSETSSSDSSEEMPGSVEGGQKYQAVIDIEGYGPVTLILDEGIAPETVKNFVNLAQSGFYDGLTFHRIIDGFMIQGGDPEGNGTGGSENTIPGEFLSNGFNNTLSHKKGVISMARSQLPNSASSQFFIVEEDSTFLDEQYAAFGYVTDGMDIVEKIAEDGSANATDDNGTIPSEDQPVISSITVTEINDSEIQ